MSRSNRLYIAELRITEDRQFEQHHMILRCVKRHFFFVPVFCKNSTISVFLFLVAIFNGGIRLAGS
jgi:hypothetical protein